VYNLIGIEDSFSSKKEMRRNLADIPWITYRDGFDPIEGWVSDWGWGCMIRVAQMMVCNSLMRHIKSQLSDETRMKHQISNTELMKNVLPLFLDDYSKAKAPFSIRNIIFKGKELLHKGAGEWYGAHSISQVIKAVNDSYNNQYYKSFRVLTFNEGIVYKDEVLNVFNVNKSSGALVIVPMRLGLKKLDRVYFAQIK
jgi:cysteine protease ATG4